MRKLTFVSNPIIAQVLLPSIPLLTVEPGGRSNEISGIIDGHLDMDRGTNSGIPQGQLGRDPEGEGNARRWKPPPIR